MSIPYIVTDDSITVVSKGKPYTITSSNAAYAEVKKRIAAGNFANIERLFDPGAAIGSFTKGNIVVSNNEVTYKGQVVNNHVVDRILAFMREGLPYQPLCRFLENLMNNPSFRAVTELYSFLEKSGLPITDDGCFLAYRKVTEDFKDFYTGKFDNSVGATVEMVRNLVDEDKNRTCSHGLHFCSHSYLSQYHGGTGRTVMVKINPADVVAIPADYNDSKGRCCKYLVVSEIPNEQEQAFGALYQANPVEAFSEEGDPESIYEAEVLVDEQASYNEGFIAGREDAESGFVRAASDSFSEENDSTLSETDYLDGYDAGFDSYYNQPAPVKVSAPKGRVCKDSTRRKLRKIARAAKRNKSGRFA